MEQDKDKLLNKQSFELDTKISATIIHKKIPLHLRSSFGTSHSSTTIRYNSFIQIILNDENSHKSFYGLGESGLPPKKPGCYLADYNDISSYINDYFTFLNSIILNKNGELNEKKFEEYITDLNKILKKDTTLPKYIYILFYSMDNCPANKYEYSNTAKNCLEGALWDLCGKILNISVLDLLNVKLRENISTFYTVSIAPDEEMIQCLHLGLKYTNYIKIKLNRDIEKAKHTLNLLDTKCEEYENKNKKLKCIWSIDLNSDFNDPSLCEKLINEVLIIYKERIYMIEQPFPIKFNDIKTHIEGWKNVKDLAEKNNMLIFADESASTVESIEPLKDIVSGVNIKLEKCGGIKNGLKCIEKGKEMNLKVWIGSMVGSSLLMNMAAILTPLSIYSDLDGFLLVDEASQPCKGGFIWDAENGTIVLSKDIGLGVTLKNENNLI
jgi:L-alanine-DL-glutamate epimerase-like enolase superfamily enzyme